MKQAFYQEALDAFANPFHEFAIEEIHAGEVNHSYKVTSKLNGSSFLLQQINRKVFPQPEHVQANYEMLWNHIQLEQLPLVIPEPKFFPDDSTLFVDSHGNCWRVFEYIYGARTFHSPENTYQARAVAQAFGSFTASFEQFDLSTLHINLPGYHHLSVRFAQMEQAVKGSSYDRLRKAAALLDDLKKRERYAHFFDVLTESEEFHQRVTHYDACIQNVLFEEDAQSVICPVDFDTVMPGYFFSDLGEMFRTMACAKPAESIGLEDQCVRKDFYEAILHGYLSVMEYQLSDAEKKYAHFAGLMMTYMQALRYASDYLGRDVFYKTEYREQNLDKARNQLALLKNLEAFLQQSYGFRI